MKPQKELLDEFLREWESGGSISARTSGSTGEPKLIQLSRKHVERSATRSIEYFGLTSESRLHAAMSFKFIGGKMMIARSLLSGCELTYSEPSANIEAPGGKKPVSLLSLVPAQMHFVLENISRFSNVEKFLVGGSAIDSRLWDRIVASGFDVWESYGMTETATHVAMRKIEGPADGRPRFRPFPGVRIWTDAEGCLQIKDADIMVSTTDLGTVDEDGTIEIIGRRDDRIITGGLKVLPQEIENIIKDKVYPFCRSFYISSVADEIWTSRLILVIVPDQDQVEEKSLQALIAAELAKIPESVLPRRFRPKEIRIVDELPVTASGKLNRRFRWD